MKFICGFSLYDSEIIEANTEAEAIEIYTQNLLSIIDNDYVKREVWVEDYEDWNLATSVGTQYYDVSFIHFNSRYRGR